MKTHANRRRARWVVLAGLQAFIFMGGLSCLNPTTDRGLRTGHFSVTDLNSLKATVISAHLHETIHPEKNLIWCGTFQMAWNECMKLTGGPLHLQPDLPLAADLNRREFTRTFADEKNCIAIADFVSNDVYGQIERALRTIASPGDYAAHRPDRTYAVRPHDIVAYAYLQTDLKFPVPFERLDDKLSFRGTPVRAFGIDPEAKPGQERLLAQIWVHAYASREDFVVELDSSLKGHRLILARVSPDTSLLATIQAVEKRLVPLPSTRDWTRLTSEQREHVGQPGDVLMVPKMAFDLTRSYTELAGRRLLPNKADLPRDLLLQDAAQTIRFEMDEKGVRLRSHAQLSFGCSATVSPRPVRWMACDGPFLLMLQREDAPLPYFAAWIANVELLQRSTETKPSASAATAPAR